MAATSFSFHDPTMDADIDLTPLIDTVFMLLVFFIMATTFSKPVLEVNLQETEGAVVQENKTEPLTITITESGLFVFEEQTVTLAELEKIIIGSSKEQGIIFNADKKAPFGLFVQTLELAKAHGKKRFAINTTNKKQTPPAQ